jgi:hypothetical protein
MKIVYQHLVEQQLDHTTPTPNWVCSMGLEWLYQLLIKVEAWSKAKQRFDRSN